MTFFAQLALNIYFFIQRIMFSPISKDEYCHLIDQNEILETDPWGVKVLETGNNRIIKIFRLKRLLSTAYFVPYALRFKCNAWLLKKKGIATVIVDEIVYCRDEQRHVLSYKKVPGQSVKSLLEKDNDNKVLLKKMLAYVALLHTKGVYFRSLHFGNIIVRPHGEFVLIDISDMRFYPFKLSINQRIRNWKHLTKYAFEKSKIGSYGWDTFFDEYAAFSLLTSKQAEEIKAGINYNL